MTGRGLITQLKYMRHRATRDKSVCDLCAIASSKKKRDFERQVGTMYIVSNDYPYKWWNIQKVRAHLLVVPKRHVLTIADMSTEEQADMMRIMSEYEADGYSFYLRSHSDKTRTIGHVHGHLFAFK